MLLKYHRNSSQKQLTRDLRPPFQENINAGIIKLFITITNGYCSED